MAGQPPDRAGHPYRPSACRCIPPSMPEANCMLPPRFACPSSGHALRLWLHHHTTGSSRGSVRWFGWRGQPCRPQVPLIHMHATTYLSMVGPPGLGDLLEATHPVPNWLQWVAALPTLLCSKGNSLRLSWPTRRLTMSGLKKSTKHVFSIFGPISVSGDFQEKTVAPLSDIHNSASGLIIWQTHRVS